jgi:hypothetical protein
VVYSFCAPPNNLGVPVSSWGTLEYNRVDLTVYILYVNFGKGGRGGRGQRKGRGATVHKRGGKYQHD